MYTTFDQIEAILSLYKDPFGTEFDMEKYMTSPTQTSFNNQTIVEMWQDQNWQDAEFDSIFVEFSVSPLTTTMFIYSVN